MLSIIHEREEKTTIIFQSLEFGLAYLPIWAPRVAPNILLESHSLDHCTHSPQSPCPLRRIH